jgi:CRISPR-associated exonuclease Cas4
MTLNQNSINSISPFSYFPSYANSYLSLQEEYIPISALNHYIYCPHRCWRMFCAGEFFDNQYTIEGSSLHERVHTVGDGNREQTWQIRAIWLKSDQYKLIGKADLIELENGEWYPVEYKRGHRGEWDNDKLQLCAQALCLEEMTGKTVNNGYVYYALSHQRQLVEITEKLRQSAIATIEAVKQLLRSGKMPKPTKTKRCDECSLYSSCLPQASEKLRRYLEDR